MKKTRSYRLALTGLAVITATLLLFFFKAPTAQLDAFWDQANPVSGDTISHELWQETLDEYLISEHSPGVNRVDYQALQEDGVEALQQYLKTQSEIDPRNYNRAEQFAFWVNLYNALTVKLITDNYPLNSITELGNSALGFGPWDDELITVAGKALTLNDIEHRILRPVWKDHRIHFAVNCASLSCPNLLAEAFTVKNQERLLIQGAHDYLLHPRALQIEGHTLHLSSIFYWYKDDFGNSQKELLQTLSQYLPEPLATQIKNHTGAIEYRYDWQLNAD